MLHRDYAIVLEKLIFTLNFGRYTILPDTDSATNQVRDLGILYSTFPIKRTEFTVVHKAKQKRQVLLVF